MGGRPKGLLPAPSGETIVARALALCERAKLDVVFVGDATAYTHLAPGVPALADEPRGIGPLGGLVALLEHASHGGARHAIALACDMPYVTLELLERLIDDAVDGEAAIVAPRRHDGHAGWEPLCARYDAARVLPSARARVLRGAHSLQGLLDDAGARELVLDATERDWLRDWDTPDDAR